MLDHPDFRAGRLDTGLIERNLDSLGAVPQARDDAAVAAGALALLAEEKARLDAAALARSGWADDPWSAGDGFALAPDRRGEIRVDVDGEAIILPVDAAGEAVLQALPRAERAFALVDGEDALYVIDRGRQTRVALVDALDVSFDALAGDAGGSVKSPMHGKLVALFVSEGEAVEKGQRVAIVEAMKMEHPVLAPKAGRVEGLAFAAGSQLGEGARIMSIVESEPAS